MVTRWIWSWLIDASITLSDKEISLNEPDKEGRAKQAFEFM